MYRNLKVDEQSLALYLMGKKLQFYARHNYKNNTF